MRRANPLSAQNVVVKGTATGTITDMDGNFVLDHVLPNAVIQISYIGYKSQDIAWKGQTTLRVTMAEDSESLQEVIVVGYGTSVKKDLTTAVTNVKNKDFLQGASNDPMQMIDGKVAGVTINSTAAADPNSRPSNTTSVPACSAGGGPLYAPCVLWDLVGEAKEAVQAFINGVEEAARKTKVMEDT